jgi:hypothetical protein
METLDILARHLAVPERVLETTGGIGLTLTDQGGTRGSAIEAGPIAATLAIPRMIHNERDLIDNLAFTIPTTPTPSNLPQTRHPPLGTPMIAHITTIHAFHGHPTIKTETHSLLHMAPPLPPLRTQAIHIHHTNDSLLILLLSPSTTTIILPMAPRHLPKLAISYLLRHLLFSHLCIVLLAHLAHLVVRIRLILLMMRLGWRPRLRRRSGADLRFGGVVILGWSLMGFCGGGFV